MFAPFWSVGLVVVLGVGSGWRFDPWSVFVPLMGAALSTIGFFTRALWRVACYEDGDVLVVRNVLATHRLPWSQITGMRLARGSFTYSGTRHHHLVIHAHGGHRVRADGARSASRARFLHTAATVRRRAEAMSVPFTVVGHDDLGWQPPATTPPAA